MKKITLFLILGVLLTSSPLTAGFSEGEDAFNNQQYTLAFTELLPLAENGDFRSQYYIGYLYLNGYGVTRDEKKALVYLQKAVDQNYDLAQSLMAYMYFEGTHVPQDKKRALSLYQQAANQGNISALLNLGILYYTGDGVEKNTQKALTYFNKIPLEQKPIAGKYLGDIYLTDQKDYTKALSYYTKAAASGDLSSYHAIAGMYQKGLGISADINEAIKYFTYAAAQNYAPSQYALGIIYANGEGIARDKYNAYAWLSLAANQQLKVAKEGRDKLTESMSLSDIEKGRRQLIELQQSTIGKVQPPLSPETVVTTPKQTSETRAPARKTRRRRR